MNFGVLSLKLVVLLVIASGLRIDVLAADPDFLKDMPRAAEVTAKIEGADTAQTLGRQCAALEILRGMLTTGDLVPYEDRRSPAVQALAQEYRDASCGSVITAA